MNARLLLFAGAALAASLFPLPVTAQADTPRVQRAICTQIEPNREQSGVSYYGGVHVCEAVASRADDPNAFGGYIPVPFDPESHGMSMVCLWPVVGYSGEYGISWSAPSYEDDATSLCYAIRDSGTPITFLNR